MNEVLNAARKIAEQSMQPLGSFHFLTSVNIKGR